MQIIRKIKSVLASAPDLGVTIRPLSEGGRIRLLMNTAVEEGRLDELRGEIELLMREVLEVAVGAKTATDSNEPGAVKLRAELDRNPEARRLAVAIAEANAVQRSIHEALLRATLANVEGMLVDVAAAGVEEFIEWAPAAVFAEAVNLARNAVGLTEEDRGNSESPTTSPA